MQSGSPVDCIDSLRGEIIAPKKLSGSNSVNAGKCSALLPEAPSDAVEASRGQLMPSEAVALPEGVSG